MDTYGDHALVCPAGGDRTIRHNALRDAVCFLCKSAGLNPEPEKTGLLRPRPQFHCLEEDGQKYKGSRSPEGRQPADVFIPCGRLGKPAALDLAVTSGLKMDLLKDTLKDGSSATSWYEGFKCSYLDTKQHCQEEVWLQRPRSVPLHRGNCANSPILVKSRRAPSRLYRSQQIFVLQHIRSGETRRRSA